MIFINQAKIEGVTAPKRKNIHKKHYRIMMKVITIQKNEMFTSTYQKQPI